MDLRHSRIGTLLTLVVLVFLAAPRPARGDEILVLEGETAGDRFGSSLVAIGDLDGDTVPDLAVGAPLFDGAAGADSGKVYLLSGADGSVLRSLEGEAAGDQFGASLAVAGDRIVVGAPFHDVGVFTSAGRAYVIAMATGVTIYVFDGEFSFDNLGFSVATADVDGDGMRDFVLGVPHFDAPAGPDSGRLYVYSGLDGTLLRMLDGENADDLLGWSVASAGHIDGDAGDDLIVADSGFDGASGSDTGRVRVLAGADLSLLFAFEGSNSGDFFGSWVAGEGDYDGNMVKDILCCAPFHDGAGGPGSGQVRIFAGDTGAPLFTRDGEQIDDRFGTSGTVISDLNGDGNEEVLIGAADHAGPQGAFSGKAYVYSGETGSLLMVFEGNAAGESLGNAVGRIGDANGDSYPDMLVGANLATGAAGPEAGRVYLFSGNPFEHCNRGVVNWGAHDIQNVLFLNGSSGGPSRTVAVAEGARIWGSIIQPPAGGNGKYVVHAYAGPPDFGTLTILPKDVGNACFPFLLSMGANPAAVWNNIGKTDKIGASHYFDGTALPDPPRASAVFFKLHTGDPVNLPAGTVMTFQSIIIDPAAVSIKGGSVSNAILLTIL